MGFVFQSYNLIPHQTVIANVEMALVLSGTPAAERRRRAEEALQAAWASATTSKRSPTSSRADRCSASPSPARIVNDPEIILADEPTGALDTETSVEVMEISEGALAATAWSSWSRTTPSWPSATPTASCASPDGLITSDTAPVDAARERLTPEQVQAHAVADATQGQALDELPLRRSASRSPTS